MHKLIIIEDDPRSAALLRSFVTSCSQAFEVRICASAAEVDEEIAANGLPDICLVSVELGGGTGGIDLVASRFPRGCATQVVYLSSNLMHAPDVYRTQHVCMLAKPVSESRLHEALDKALFYSDEKPAEPLLIRSFGSLVSVRPAQIVFVESDRRKVRVHTTRSVLESYSSLSDIAAVLPSNFVQCHKSFLINLSYVAELGKTDIVTTTGETVPVSQRRHKATVEALASHMRML